MALKNKKRPAALTPAEVQKTLHKNLEFIASEQYRLLRTNIKFTVPADVKCPIIGVTSSIRGEGKSTTAVNLSYVLAHKGHKVLLVDGDLRIPSIAKKMGVKSTPGLTDLLIGSSADIASWKSEIHKNWYILPSGEIPPNPSELLGSKRMENVLNVLSEHFDYIIVDLPPVNIVSDAMAISSYITGMIIVIREGYTSKKDLDRCMRQIKLSDVNVLGCVMNESEEGSASYSKYGRYKRNRHYYSEEYKIQDKEEFNL
ncbi:MAG: CpsD/CapB family tyrosine-protein kinase [Ruminococcaceae bacterium]|nr:CpsD/CapB family tyrosine-protein kinase [Oscillospiraceae bacterium]